MNIKVKICGLKTKEEVQASIACGADYVGFVFFHKSPRNVTAKQAEKITKGIGSAVETVAVVVDASDGDIDDMLKAFKPDYIQCHGNETSKRIIEIKHKYGIKVIKAIAVRSSDDIAKAMNYAKVSDMILFDAKVPSSPLPGGNGISFDWTLLRGREFNIPWILSGGLNIQNVKDAIKISGAKMVDVSSSVESEPGVKDAGLVNEFIKMAKRV